MKKRLFFWTAFVVVGALIGFGLLRISQNSAGQQSVLPAACKTNLLNPTFCSEKRKIHFINEVSLDNQLRDYISAMELAHNVIRASVYYRDLQNGPIVNIDANEKYYAGSLLKVPLMILYLKYAQRDKGILDTKVFVDDDILPSQLKDRSQTAERGKTYTVKELIEKMIIYSDNSSKDALRKHTPDILGPQASVDAVLKDLGVEDPAEETGLLTLKEYASIFRSLYNAQYLTPEMSQLALEILSRTTYDRGMAAGIPKGIVVANKFGTPLPSISTNPQLHDCGIIYHTVSPYLLCIFTEGKDYFAMEKVITQISKDVYTTVDKVN